MPVSSLREGRFRLGIDIGGTFTDFSLVDESTGEVHVHKRPSTPNSPSTSVVAGLQELMERIGRAPADITTFVHGTTIGLNAVLERRGARVALFVSEGNRDVLEIARLARSEKLTIKASPAVPLVPRRNVYEVKGRLAADGTIIEELAPHAAEGVARRLRDEGDIDAYAICLLNAHANPEHETVLAQVLEGVSQSGCTRSSDLWPEIREYERAVVAVLNAYVQPIMRRYIDTLLQDTERVGLATRIYITQSNGGVASVETARSKPIGTLLSGPASGVVGAAYVGRIAGVRHAVTVDIGGTSADVSLVKDSEPVHSTEAAIGDLPLVMPAVDVFSVGAGGGSIAWVDDFGLLKVGPRSAGADPGPACYGLGGTEPTVTDAYVVCGYINPSNFLGGAMRLDRRRAEDAVGALAARLGRRTEAAAQDILEIATNTMSTALLPMMTKRGVDPRDYTLIPFGGAGATHACLLSDDIGIARILVPPAPGTLCALGAAISDSKADYIRSWRTSLADADFSAIRAGFADMERQARQWLAADSPVVEGVDLHRSADMRYRGQAFTIDVAIPGPADSLGEQLVAACFHHRYEELYGGSYPDSTIELVNLRLRVVGRRAAVNLRPLVRVSEGTRPLSRGRRRILYGRDAHDADVYERSDLQAGHAFEGPALVEQFDTTTVVGPGRRVTVDDYGILKISPAGEVDGGQHGQS